MSVSVLATACLGVNLSFDRIPALGPIEQSVRDHVRGRIDVVHVRVTGIVTVITEVGLAGQVEGYQGTERAVARELKCALEHVCGAGAVDEVSAAILDCIEWSVVAGR